MTTPFFSQFVTMDDEWETFTVKDGDETFTVNADEWTCTCNQENCIHTRMAREYYESHLKIYDYNSEMAAMLYDDWEE